MMKFSLSFTPEEKRVFLFIMVSLIAGILLSRSTPLNRKIPIASLTEKIDTLRVDINKAGYNDLIRLPGVGPVLARRIIDKREELGGFRSVEDLLKVKGIGKTKLEKLRSRIIIEDD